METTGKQLGDRDVYPWDECVADMIEQYGDEETAQKVCGMIKAKYGAARPENIAAARKEAEEALGMSKAHNYIRMFRETGEAPPPLPGTPLRFVASTEALARDGFSIRADGWQLDNYRKNPVVLWGHDYVSRPPIGRAAVQIEAGRLTSDIVFDQGDDFAREVERKYRDGFLHAVSVGWNTVEQDGQTVTRAELLDISAVPVPGDPDALIQRQTAAMRAYLDGVMQSGLQATGQRYGTVLNARNKDALRQALELIQSVLESAEKHAETDEKEDGDETERALQQIVDRLQSI